MDVTLDQDSAHPRLIISEDGKQVHCSDRYQLVPDTAERFDRVVCVLGRQGISSGCHYWEVVVGEKTDWDIGIASRSINRKGKITANPANGFWFLSLRDKHEYVFRTEPSMPIIVQTKPQCVGVYVDYEKGQLSFYNADTKSLIFTFTDSFSDTLYPFFSPCTNKSGKNEAPLIICPAYSANPSWLTEKWNIAQRVCLLYYFIPNDENGYGFHLQSMWSFHWLNDFIYNQQNIKQVNPYRLFDIP